MSADVRSSFTTVNGPAPVAMAIASTSAGAGEELSNSEPPPAAAATPSAGPGSPPDVSQSEDAANGQGGPRKPNNMWTAEDREDMFNRRELGETWESICAVSTGSFSARHPSLVCCCAKYSSIAVGTGVGEEQQYLAAAHFPVHLL